MSWQGLIFKTLGGKFEAPTGYIIGILADYKQGNTAENKTMIGEM